MCFSPSLPVFVSVTLTDYVQKRLKDFDGIQGLEKKIEKVNQTAIQYYCNLFITRPIEFFSENNIYSLSPQGV